MTTATWPLNYALRNGVNGIGNALAAYLVIQLPTVLGWSSHNAQKISLRQAIFTLLVASALTVLDRAGRIVAASRGDLVPGQVYVHEGSIRFDPISPLDGESQVPRMITTDVR